MEGYANPAVPKLMRALMRFSKTEWHRRTAAGCTPSQVKLLFCVKNGTQAGNADMKVSDISRVLRVTSPTVTQLVKDLEAEGLVERRVDQSDRRVVGIALTEKGKAVAQRAHDSYVASLNELAEYLGEEQTDQLAELLMKVFNFYLERQTHERRAIFDGDEQA